MTALRLRDAVARRVVRARRRDDGRAIVEFVVLGVLVLLPVVYLVATVARLQAAAYAVATASREAGRAFTTASDDTAADRRGQAAAQISFQDYGFSPGGTVSLRCDGTPCLRPQGRVEAVAQVSVRLPLVPDFMSAAIPTVIPVSATHVATVDRFRGSG